MKHEAPLCPHTTESGRRTCADRMVERGPGLWECPHDHSGHRVKRRPAAQYPDIPRFEESGRA